MIQTEKWPESRSLGHSRNWHEVPVAGGVGTGWGGGEREIGENFPFQLRGVRDKEDPPSFPHKQVWGRETGGFLLQLLSLGSQALVCCSH